MRAVAGLRHIGLVVGTGLHDQRVLGFRGLRDRRRAGFADLDDEGPAIVAGPVDLEWFGIVAVVRTIPRIPVGTPVAVVAVARISLADAGAVPARIARRCLVVAGEC